MIQNYVDLRLAVSDLVGNRSISDVFPMLVQMAESDLNTRLRTRRQLTVETLNFEEGESPLPPDFLEVKSFMNRYGRLFYPDYEVDGYSIRIPDYTGDLDIEYYTRLPTITKSPTSTNWLIARYPGVYLYGVGFQAAKFLKDVDLARATELLYSQAIGALEADDKAARYSNQVVRVQGMTP